MKFYLHGATHKERWNALKNGKNWKFNMGD